MTMPKKVQKKAPTKDPKPPLGINERDLLGFSKVAFRLLGELKTISDLIDKIGDEKKRFYDDNAP